MLPSIAFVNGGLNINICLVDRQHQHSTTPTHKKKTITLENIIPLLANDNNKYAEHLPINNMTESLYR